MCVSRPRFLQAVVSRAVLAWVHGFPCIKRNHKNKGARPEQCFDFVCQIATVLTQIWPSHTSVMKKEQPHQTRMVPDRSHSCRVCGMGSFSSTAPNPRLPYWTGSALALWCLGGGCCYGWSVPSVTTTQNHVQGESNTVHPFNWRLHPLLAARQHTQPPGECGGGKVCHFSHFQLPRVDMRSSTDANHIQPF